MIHGPHHWSFLYFLFFIQCSQCLVQLLIHFLCAACTLSRRSEPLSTTSQWAQTKPTEYYVWTFNASATIHMFECISWEHYIIGADSTRMHSKRTTPRDLLSPIQAEFNWNGVTRYLLCFYEAWEVLWHHYLYE